MKPVRYFPKKVRGEWDSAAPGHVPGPEATARVLTDSRLWV